VSIYLKENHLKEYFMFMPLIFANHM